MVNILFTVATLSLLGALAAVILFYVVKRFHVEEDPRIDDVEKLLPGANCAGCGFAGCRGLADALVKRDDISNLYCPVAGAEPMKQIASYLGKQAAEKMPQVATLRCGGCNEKRPRTNVYDGARSCRIAASLYVGESSCPNGCLGFGDCEAVCKFGAIKINGESGLVEIDTDKCTACSTCVRTCPRQVIELRKRWPKGQALYVACSSKLKGALTMKMCKAGCIGCRKCLKACPFEAITVENNLAYIDSLKCKLCRKCVGECPTGAIHMRKLPPLKLAEAKDEKAKDGAKAKQSEEKAKQGDQASA